MSTAITAIGIANPAFKRRQLETAELICSALNLSLAEKRLLKSIYKSSGIEERYSVLSDYCKSPGEFVFFPNDPKDAFPPTSARMTIYKNNALTLALAAIQDCFKTVNHFDKNHITHLITISCTGMYAPGIDIEIVQKLNLNSEVKRTAINFMGCYGAFNGIKMADMICKADPNAKVLLVSVEICTIHFQKNQSVTNMISNAIFADGAAAVLIEKKPHRKKCFELMAFHCDLLPQTEQEMAWHISDFGFDIVLSTYVPEVIKSGIGQFTERLLEKKQITFSEVDMYAIHPGGLKILQACEESLHITPEDNKHSYAILKQYGNMSSATILFVLKKIWDGLEKNFYSKTIFSCAFGPGLTLESMLLKAENEENG